MAPAASSLAVARNSRAFFVRLSGRCTMMQSPAFHAFAERAMQEPDRTLYVDVAGCEYLDSTFLGSLLDLHRRSGKASSGRFRLIAPADAVERLFAPTHLHKVFKVDNSYPDEVGTWVDLKCDSHPSQAEMARHVLECHRRLAETDGPNQQAFAAIADKLERELSDGTSPAGR